MSGTEWRSYAFLPAAFLGSLIVLDLVSSLAKPSFTKIEFPSEVFVGDDGKFVLKFSNSLSDLRVQIGWPEGLSGPEEISIVGNLESEFSFRAVKRGVWELKDVWVLWPSRFRLLEFLPKLVVDAKVRVVPNIKLVQSGEITSKVFSSLYGVKENRSLGEGSEFHQLQEFVNGMDPRTIDWKRSAKLRLLVAKDSQAERNHHVIIALDNGYLMGQTVGLVPKIDHAVTAALGVAWAAAIGGDLVGYFNFDVKPRQYFAPEPGRKAFVKLRASAADMTYSSRETNHTLALTELYAKSPKRSLMIVFTDFTDTTSAELMIENIGLLAKRHLLIFVAIRDPELDTLAKTVPKSLEGVAGVVAAHDALNQRRLVLERIARLGVTIVDATPNLVTAKLISNYLDIKAKEMI